MKRVLIISNNALSFSSNNGKTISSFFSEWCGEDLAQIYFNNEVPESKTMLNFFKIMGFEQFISLFKFPKFSAGRVVRPIQDKNNAGHGLYRNNFKRHFIEFINNRFEAVKLYARDLAYGTGLNKNKKLLRWIESFKPDCIFIVVGNSCFSIDFSIAISKGFQIPIVTYVTDDYVIGNTPVGFFGKAYHARLVNKYADLFSCSTKNFFIGDLMLQAFEQKFSVKGDTLINCNLIQRSNFLKKTSKDSGEVRVVFAGGLHLGRDRSIISFVKIMKDACIKCGFSLCVDIYSSQKVSGSLIKEFEFYGVTYKGSVSWEVLEIELQQADFLLHVESFLEVFYKKTMFSLSTKLPEYLSSGVCVIGYGPSSIASIRILLDNNVGVALTGMEGKELSVLYRAIESSEFRRLISQRGELFAENNFSPEIIRAKLYKCLMEL